MNIFDNIKQWFKGVVHRMLGKEEIKRALGIEITTSDVMIKQISLWNDLYAGNAPWLCEEIHSLGLPSLISSELAQMVTLELSVKIEGSPRAEFLQQSFDYVLKNIRTQTEFAASTGGMIFKPFVYNGKIGVDFVQSNQFAVTASDSSGNITGAVFSEVKSMGKDRYTRLEYHDWHDQQYEIKNVAFKNADESIQTLGSPVSLDSVDEWAQLQEHVIIHNVDRILFAYFKMPFANNIDPSSPLGVSVFARAIDLIQQADTLYSGLLWEYESSKRALFLDETMFSTDPITRKRIVPNTRLYKNLKAIGNETLFEEWSPNIREQNYINGINELHVRIEDVCGLARGTLSNVVSMAAKGERTATEIRILKQRTFATVTGIQKALQTALDDLLYAMDIWTTLAGLAPNGKYQVSYDFDDSVISDRGAQFKEYMELIALQAATPAELRAWYFSIPLEQAQQELQNVGQFNLFADEPNNVNI